MSAPDAENLSFIRHDSSTELRNVKVNVKHCFGLFEFFDLEKMNIARAPLEIVDELTACVALLENEGVLH